MLAGVTFNKHRSNLKLYLVGTMLNIPLDMPSFSRFVLCYSEHNIESMFYLYNTSGRFSRTFLGDSFAVVYPNEIEMIHGILRNG